MTRGIVMTSISEPSLTTRAPRPDLFIAATIIALIALSATYTIAGVGMEMSAIQMTFGGMMGEATMAMNAPGVWGAKKAMLVFLMWWAMMIAMMLPSAAPTILLYRSLLRRTRAAFAARISATVFLFGYLVTWMGFSLVATGVQWQLEASGLISLTTMALSKGTVTALILIAAGAYQFHPLKDRCLTLCRHPAEFIARHHRSGLWGATRLGMLHGAFCLGCCLALMALLFVGGIMSLYWIVGLSVLVALEKLAPRGRLIGLIAGAGLIGFGGAQL